MKDLDLKLEKKYLRHMTEEINKFEKYFEKMIEPV